MISVPTGLNATIFAYGQTGSGKTHTMFGPHWDLGYITTSKQGQLTEFLQTGEQSDRGVIPRSISDIFDEINQSYESEGTVFNVYCSFIQIYNEKLFDLLQDQNGTNQESLKNNLNIREDKQEGTFVEGLTEYQVTCINDWLTLLRRGEKNRTTRQTNANNRSSRSHTIFQILIEAALPTDDGAMTKSKLNLWDLAGSEKIQTEERLEEKHMIEHKNINLSLTTLGKVVAALAKNSAKSGIPYRESKLTKLLKDSLGGNTKTVLIATVSPLKWFVDETISTLKFADRAKQVLVKASVNEVSSKDDEIVRKLKREVQHLKEILNLRRNKTDQDIQRELLTLKEQNYKLKELASKGQQVDTLIRENQSLKSELTRYKLPQNSDGFLAWQKKLPEMIGSPNPMSHTYFNTSATNANVFLTEADMNSQNDDLRGYGSFLLIKRSIVNQFLMFIKKITTIQSWCSKIMNQSPNQIFHVRFWDVIEGLVSINVGNNVLNTIQSQGNLDSEHSMTKGTYILVQSSCWNFGLIEYFSELLKQFHSYLFSCFQK